MTGRDTCLARDGPIPAATDVTQATPTAVGDEDQNALSRLAGMVTLTFASWNQTTARLRQLESRRQWRELLALLS